MNCASCGAQVPALFGHAIKKNECPACGNALMDEESMALVEELRGFVLKSVKVREETADTLATALIAAYDIRYRDGAPVQQPLSRRVTRSSKSGTIVQRSNGDEDGGEENGGEVDPGIVKVSDIFDPSNSLSPDERDAILQERIENRLITQAMVPNVVTRVRQLTDTEMAESPVLETQRLKRLQEQEAREQAGVSKIHRRT